MSLYRMCSFAEPCAASWAGIANASAASRVGAMRCFLCEEFTVASPSGWKSVKLPLRGSGEKRREQALQRFLTSERFSQPDECRIAAERGSCWRDVGLGALLNFLPSWHLEVLSFPALSAGCFDLGSPSNGRQRLRFGLFEADLASGELYKRGRLIRLQDQPFRILAMLLERPGEIVSREEVQKKLWREGTFVDFDEGLDTALRKLRQALGDSPQNSTFVETIPRRGYRFIAPVQGTENGSEAEVTAETVPGPSPVVPLEESTTAGKEHPVTRGIGSGWQLLAAGVLAIAVLAFITVRVAKRKPVSPLQLKQRQLTINSNENAVVSGAISPDGRFLAYSDPMGIHVKLIETGETQTLPRPDDLKGLQVSWAIVPTWVRDGTILIANADVPRQPASVVLF